MSGRLLTPASVINALALARPVLSGRGQGQLASMAFLAPNSGLAWPKAAALFLPPWVRCPALCPSRLRPRSGFCR